MERFRTAFRLCVVLALIGGTALAGHPAAGAETRTLKEKLSDKASDEQRVDDCGVPPERRGTVKRPGCDGEDMPAGAQRDVPASPASPVSNPVPAD
ncbi:MAG: hypothetical protein BroJett029_14210 [Alphaproteobacteria bacterium]|nr:MAG: hypothetical protein BroJett029_14210 [Alphaproteobacteria bacterium]